VHRLSLRLKKIERRLPGPSQPTKKIVPEWLIEEFQKQGIGVAADGRPEPVAKAPPPVWFIEEGGAQSMRPEWLDDKLKRHVSWGDV
jgi:hypothetical protein